MTVESESVSTEALRLMRSHSYFHGLPETLLREVAEEMVVRRLQTGDVLYQANQVVQQVGFIVAGRIKGLIVDALGHEKLLRFAERGESVGLISAALRDSLPITAVAVEQTTMLMLDYEKAMELTAKFPELRSQWNQKLSGALITHLLGDQLKRETSVFAVFHQTDKTRPLTERLARRFRTLGDSVGVFTDRENFPQIEGIPVRRMYDRGNRITEAEVHEQIGNWGKPRRVIVDVSANLDDTATGRLMALSNQVVWISDEDHWRDSVERLRRVEADSPDVRDKITFVWARSNLGPVPQATEVNTFASHDVKVELEGSEAAHQATRQPGFERLMNRLQGICVGVALGGGAARGMAHLGVLRALDEAGIYVDQIAGTSAGAMVGMLYAAGHSPDYLIESFTRDLQPSWPFRLFPGGGYWYLAYKYRMRQFGPMLRRYLADAQIQQLPISSAAVTVDLVSGRPLVRRSGNAVDAVLDSINLPVLSRPILRRGQALIDGGYVNNVPADVLVSQGCNFVIAVDVLANIEQEFAGLRSETPAENGKPPNSMQTLLRTYAVQSFNMNSIGVQPADVCIEPDTSAYSMSAFTQAAGLAEIGQNAALEKLPAIQSLMERLSGATVSSRTLDNHG